MTFGQEYLTHLRVIQNIGMAGIEPIMFKGREIIPIQFLKAVLPDPGELGENYTGQDIHRMQNQRASRMERKELLYLQ